MNIYSLYKHVKISYSCCEEVSIVSVIFIRQLKMSLNEQRIFEINITAKRLFKNAMKSDVGWPHGAASHHQILCQIWKKKIKTKQMVEETGKTWNLFEITYLRMTQASFCWSVRLYPLIKQWMQQKSVRLTKNYNATLKSFLQLNIRLGCATYIGNVHKMITPNLRMYVALIFIRMHYYTLY